MRRRRVARLVPALLALVIAAACGNGRRLRDLERLDEFRAEFNRDQGRLRLVLLLSPT